MKKKKPKLTEFTEPNLPMKPMARPLITEPWFKDPKTIEVLAECKKRIDDYTEDMVQRWWLIGEQLTLAKKAIIKETGDKRGRGFTEWVESNFHFSGSHAWRMMKAYRERINDPSILYNKQKKIAPTQAKSEEFKFTDKNYHWKVTVDTRNTKVIYFFQNLKNYPETEVKIEEHPGGELGPTMVCLHRDCEVELNDRNKTGLCREHYQDVLKNPDVGKDLKPGKRYEKLEQRIEKYLELYGKK